MKTVYCFIMVNQNALKNKDSNTLILLFFVKDSLMLLADYEMGLGLSF